MHIIQEQQLQDIINNLDKLDITLTNEKQASLCSFVKFTLVYDNTPLNDAVFILKDADILNYHPEYSNKTLIVLAKTDYQLNIIKLLNHIKELLKSNYTVNNYYNGVNDEHLSFKLDIPIQDKQFLVNKTKHDSVLDVFKNCTISAYININQICKKGKQFVSVKPRAIAINTKPIILDLDF